MLASRESLTDRRARRRAAVALAHQYRDRDGLSLAAIAERLDRKPATIAAYFQDPTGERMRAVRERYRGTCRQCGARTAPRGGRNSAYTHCHNCRPGAATRRWTQERILEAMRQWREKYGELPTSYDWSRTHARRRGNEAVARLQEGQWPAASTVGEVFKSWPAAREAANGSQLESLTQR